MNNIYLIFGLLLGLNIGVFIGYGIAYKKFDAICSKLLIGIGETMKKAGRNVKADELHK